MYPLPNAPTYPNLGPTDLFADFTGCVALFVYWIEDYPLLDGLKMPSHVGSYDEKGHPDNYLHLFEGAIRSILNYEDLKAKFRSHFSQQKKFMKTHLAVHNIKQREGESTRAFVTRYTDDTLQILRLHEEPRFYGFVHGLKTRSLVEFLSTDLLTTYKGLMEKTYTWIEVREVATNETPNDHRDSFDRFKKKSSWDNNKGKKNRDKFSPYRGTNHGLLSNSSKSPREILVTEKVAKTFEQPPHMIRSRRSRDMTKSSSPQNLLLGRTVMQRMGIVVSTIHKAIKFHTPIGIGIVFLMYELDKVGEGQKKQKKVSLEVTKGVLNCADAKERIVVNDKYPEQMVIIRKKLPPTFKKRLQDLLRSNADIFIWTHADMMGIPRTITVGGKPFIIEHKLNEYKHIRPVKQKKRGLNPDRNKAACKEVEELMKAGILRKVKDQTRVANLVMVKKSNGGWRMCVDFTDINNAFPKDCDPLPEIDWKSTSKEGMIKDIQKTFDRFRSVNMKLNPKKCSFGVEEGPFLLKGAEKLLPFFKALRSCIDKKTIQWTADSEEAFQRIKKFMEILPTLTAPIKGEVLVMYLAASTKSISAILLAEKGEEQVPIYFIPNDFYIEIPFKEDETMTVRGTLPKKEKSKLDDIWKLYIDGASRSDGSGVGLILISPGGKEYTYALRFEFEATNNVQSMKRY
ncbi:hypothetical protein Tco_0887866 [Tanacetum coccineum]